MNKRNPGSLATAALAAALALAPLAARADDPRAQEAGSDFGIGVVAVFANVVYMPVKTVYGVLGAVTGGFAYVLTGGNRDVADGVWVPSLGGDYVLTTDMMTGRERVHFSGVRARGGSQDEDGPASEDESEGSNF